MLNENSNFWIGEIEDFDRLREDDNLRYLLLLSSYKNSIGNFVNIMTNRNDIKVKFNTVEKSFTDGKVVTIGPDISNGNIDVSVGVALHESAHIVKTDMAYFRTFWSKVPPNITKISKAKNYKDNVISELSTDVLNYVEDRYIDNWAYESAPGYRGYYDKMYERYWHSRLVSDGLRSCFFRTQNIDSYKFRFINMTNEDSDLDALPGLREIYELLDFENIDRLDTQDKRGKLSIEIVKIIIENLGENLELDYMDQLENPDRPEPKSGGEGEPEEIEEPDDSKGADNKSDKTDKTGDSGSSVETPQEFKDQLKEQLDFLKGDITKNQLTSDESSLLENIEKSDTSMSASGGTDGVPMIPCVVIKKINREIINSGIVPMSVSMAEPSKESVEKGIVMGTVLGKKLQIRGESKSTKFNRLARGKIDKRLLSGLGYNNSNVFYNINVDEYKKAFVHISVDSSVSMRQDDKWENVMICTVAICKAVSMIQNIDVCVTFRSTTRSHAESLPVVVVGYDSRVDKFSKVQQLFPSLCPNGATPEGLAFQPTLGLIPRPNHELDVYFLNFSDGEPYFPYRNFNYIGTSAAKHTKRQVDKIKSTGTEILSYFVGERTDSMELFKLMYGLGAKMINVTDVTSVSKTLNDKFLEKNRD